MPAARRTLSQIKAETIRRLKGIDAPGFDSRVEYWLYAALLDLATTLHHFELDAQASVTVGTNANYGQLSPTAGAYIVTNAKLLDANTGALVATLLESDARNLIDGWDGGAVPAVPARWGRYGSKIYFDCTPNASYTLSLWVYNLPAVPDFTGSAVSQLAPDCDEYLIVRALSLAWPDLNRPDLAQVQEAKLEKWLQIQPRPLLVAEPLASRKERITAGSAFGGAQG